jgi:UDP-N-acetylmuramoyl-tripeptide--D-alanyl-D-alanine ligase
VGGTRMHVEELGDIRVLNDTYNANPLSVAAALELLSFLPTTGRRVVVLGDMNELSVHTPC